jgi:hypothetical protein
VIEDSDTHGSQIQNYVAPEREIRLRRFLSDMPQDLKHLEDSVILASIGIQQGDMTST